MTDFQSSLGSCIGVVSQLPSKSIVGFVRTQLLLFPLTCGSVKDDKDM